MALADHPTQVHQGEGVVAHLGGAIVVALPDSAEHRATTRSVIDTATAAVSSGGVTVVRRLAGVLGDVDAADVPPLAVIADAGEDGEVAVLLHGDADLVVHTSGASERLTGSSAATWVDRVVPAGWDRIEVMATGVEPPPFDPLVDLRGGSVLGSGVSIVTSAALSATSPTGDPGTPADPVVPAPPPPPMATPAPEEPRTFVAVSLDEPDDEPVERAPLAVVTADLPAEAVAAQAEDAPATVLGILCKNDHFNDPDVLYCGICGISTVQETRNLVEGPRPALGVLVLDDGATFLVDDHYVIGREPDHAPEVRSGDARPLPLADTQRTLSRVHAKVVLDGWQVTVVDAGSANGTFVATPDAQEWTRLVPDTPTPIRPGTHLLVGHRTFVFESHRGTG